MNKDLFLRYIENDRDCEKNRLDMAVNMGLRMAKNERFDSKKMFILAAAGVFAFALCAAINLAPFTMVVEEYYRSRQEIMPGSSQALNGYIKDITGNLKKYLGGE